LKSLSSGARPPVLSYGQATTALQAQGDAAGLDHGLGLEGLPLALRPDQPVAATVRSVAVPAPRTVPPLADVFQAPPAPPLLLDWLFRHDLAQRVWTAVPAGDGVTGHQALLAAASPGGPALDDKAVSLRQLSEPAAGAPLAVGADGEGRVVAATKQTAARVEEDRRWFPLLDQLFGG
jgi:hypothetical protein